MPAAGPGDGEGGGDEVVFDGALGEVEVGGDLAVREAGRQSGSVRSVARHLERATDGQARGVPPLTLTRH